MKIEKTTKIEFTVDDISRLLLQKGILIMNKENVNLILSEDKKSVILICSDSSDDVDLDKNEGIDYFKLSEEMTEELFNKPIEALDLSVRTTNCLKTYHLKTLGSLVTKSELDLLGLENFGEKSLIEIIEKLKAFKLSLRKPKKVEKEETEKPQENQSGTNKILDKELLDFDLSIRLINVFASNDIYKISDLIKYKESEVRKFNRMGKITLSELRDFLIKNKLELIKED